MPIKATAVDGTEVEVELPEGYVAPEDIRSNYVPKSFMEKELARRANSMARSQLDAMFSDEAQRAELLTKLGVDPTAPTKKGAVDPEAFAKARQEWEAKDLAPLRTKLEEMTGVVQRTREKALSADIVTAAQNAGFAPEFLKAPAKGVVAPVVAMFGSLFAHDADHDGFFVRDGDSFAYSGKPTANQPYKTVAEWFEEFAGSKDAAPYLRKDAQNGPGFRPGSERGAGGPVRLTRTDARDAAKYRAAKAKAEQMGTEIEIVDG
jgi:hypothetical protein